MVMRARPLPAGKTSTRRTCGATSKFTGEACVLSPHQVGLHQDRFGQTFQGDARLPSLHRALPPVKTVAPGGEGGFRGLAGGREVIIREARNPKEAYEIALSTYGSVQGGFRPNFYKRTLREGEGVLLLERGRHGPREASNRAAALPPSRTSWGEAHAESAPPGVHHQAWAAVKEVMEPQDVRNLLAAGFSHQGIIDLLRQPPTPPPARARPVLAPPTPPPPPPERRPAPSRRDVAAAAVDQARGELRSLTTQAGLVLRSDRPALPQSGPGAARQLAAGAHKKTSAPKRRR